MNSRLLLSVLDRAPMRLKIASQPGYGQAKYVMWIEAGASLVGTALGKGGFWDDRGIYNWHAGI